MQAVGAAEGRFEMSCAQVCQRKTDCAVAVMTFAPALKDEVSSGGSCQFERSNFVEQVLLAFKVVSDGQCPCFKADGHVLQKHRFRDLHVLAASGHVRTSGHDNGVVFDPCIVQGRREWRAQARRVDGEGPVRNLVEALCQEVGKVGLAVKLDRFLEHDGTPSRS